MSFKIIDNFLSKTYYNQIFDLMTSNNFPWFYNPNISYDNGNQKLNYEYGFFHIFINNNGQAISPFSDFIKPLLYQIMDSTNTKKIIRTRGDMVTYKSKKIVHQAHIDFENSDLLNNKSVVFYINETDGNTILYNEKYSQDFKIKKLTINTEVNPKPNRLLIFDGNILHTGCSPIKYANRILINANFI